MLNKSQEKIVNAIRELSKGTTSKKIAYLDEITNKTGIAKPNLTSKYIPLMIYMGIIKKRSPYIINEIVYKKLK